MKFDELNLPKELVQNLSSLNIDTMTKIQELSLEKVFSKNDFIIQSATGSGKSAVFIINTLIQITQKDLFHTLVLTPTRELANQVSVEYKKFARHIPNIKVVTLCGGVPSRPQKNSLKYGANIIVGTPGRVLMLLRENFLELDNLKTFVLDEADRMLEMGFSEDIEKIEEYLPKNRQTLLFSATYEDNILQICNKILNKPQIITSLENKPKINEKNFLVQNSEKNEYLIDLINSFKPTSLIIFCNQKITCDEVSDYLHDNAIESLILYSDHEQPVREEIITLFSNKSSPILIATDVASRGLDIDDIDLVINYDIPRDEKVKTHRIGRTARAGKNGMAINLFTKNDLSTYKDIVFDEFTPSEERFEIVPQYVAVYISGGKGLKLRKGDILGTLAKDIGIDSNDIGNIDIFEKCSYVAIKQNGINKLKNKKSIRVKNKEFRIYIR